MFANFPYGLFIPTYVGLEFFLRSSSEVVKRARFRLWSFGFASSILALALIQIFLLACCTIHCFLVLFFVRAASPNRGCLIFASIFNESSESSSHLCNPSLPITNHYHVSKNKQITKNQTTQTNHKCSEKVQLSSHNNNREKNSR